MKKAIKWIRILLITLLLAVSIIIKWIGRLLITLLLVVSIKASIVCYNIDSVILKGYNDKIEKELDVWQSSFANNIYYYDSSFDEKYANHKDFIKVDNNIESIIELLYECMSYDDFEYYISHIKEIISEDDYFSLFDESSNKELDFRLYIYDINEHTLYYLKIYE